MRFSTQSVHAGHRPDPATGALITPIYQTSAYVQKSSFKGMSSNKNDNPTRTSLEENLSSLEEGRFCITFASDSSASNAILNLLSPGSHVVISNNLYFNSHSLFNKLLTQSSLSFTPVDSSNPQALEKAIHNETKMVWLATPSQPLMKIANLEKMMELLKGRDIISVVDNTLATPYCQQPLKLGIDLVMHNHTRYLCGHSDASASAVITNRQELLDRLAFSQKTAGSPPSPFDSWLILRGTKTLAVRIERQISNAIKIASFLKEHKMVDTVYYPGLPDSPYQELAKNQMAGFGAVVSFEIKGGTKAAGDFVNSTRIFLLSDSIGSVESLIDHPATMSHSHMSTEERECLGIKDDLIRISVGIEDVEDLLDDLKTAFDSISL